MTRREPLIGDVFAVRGTGLLGRVVSTSAVVGPTHGCILVYVYAGAKLAREALLLPPMITTRAPWSHGTFEHRRSQPLLPGDYFEQHCFRDARGAFVDEEGRPIETAFEPVGECRILEVSAIEEAIARARARVGAVTTAREATGGEGEYDLEPRPPSVDEYVRLRLEAGLSAKTPDAARAGLAGTWFGVTVRARGEAVGMGRVVGDGGCFFQVVDIAVLPGHQRRGLGKRIMAALVEHLRAHAPATAHVSLLADGEAHRLYEQFGFRATAPASIGMALKL